MLCAQLLFATELLFHLQRHALLPQVIIPVERELAELTVKTWRLPWRITSDVNGFVTFAKENGTD